MRRITSEICYAFERRHALRIDNSRTDGNALYLFDNKIAEFRDGELWITNAGWQSKTTKERLNGLRGVRVVQERGQWYLNGIPWSGEWVQVSCFGHEWQAVSAEPEEVEFDMTSEWTGSYSKPVHAVFHTNDPNRLDSVEQVLSGAGIVSRRHETDTSGKWLPNYFVVVLPEDADKARRLTEEL
jgi:hypothetical protein